MGTFMSQIKEYKIGDPNLDAARRCLYDSTTSFTTFVTTTQIATDLIAAAVLPRRIESPLMKILDWSPESLAESDIFNPTFPAALNNNDTASNSMNDTMEYLSEFLVVMIVLIVSIAI